MNRMSTLWQKVYWVIWCLFILVGMFSCNGDKNNPFVLEQLSNEQVGVFQGTDYFQIEVPTGDYLLTYTTNSGTYNMVFRATATTPVAVWLKKNDRVEQVVLWEGTITAQQPLSTKGAIAYFVKPWSQIPWNTVFAKHPDKTPIPVIRDGSPGIRVLPDPGLTQYLDVKILENGHQISVYPGPNCEPWIGEYVLTWFYLERPPCPQYNINIWVIRISNSLENAYSDVTIETQNDTIRFHCLTKSANMYFSVWFPEGIIKDIAPDHASCTAQ
jgi:hypothetical protein